MHLPTTKVDLEKLKKELATEADLRREVDGVKMELRGEIKATERVLRAEIRITAQETKEEIKEEMKQMEGRILDVLDEFVGELKTSREERTIAASQISEVRKIIF